MALNLQSLSITSAFNSIVNFFRSQENNTKWRDLSRGSEGSFLIRLLSNVISTLSYRIVAQSRENYLSTAALTSSNVGIAVNLGYSAFRGSNLKRNVYLTPNGNYTIPKFTAIGAYNTDYSILTLEDIELEEGVTKEIRTVVGNLREESFIAGTSNTKVFTLFTSNISEDYILYEDGAEVPTTKIIKELADDKFLVRTNPYLSVDVMYLNTRETARYKYGTGTEFTIRYVELANVPVIPYTDDMFSYGTLEDVVNVSSYIPFESVESIKVNAPLEHETQNLIRSKKDYANRMQQIIPSVIEANYEPLTPTYTQISYLKNDTTLLTGTKVYVGTGSENKERLGDTEVGEVLNILKEENFFGTPLPDIVPPRREVADLAIDIALTNKYKSISDISMDIDNILTNFYHTTLALSFNIYELERRIEALSYVKYARVSFKVRERDISTNYQLGYVIQDSETKDYYKASKILGYTGDSEPNWQVPVEPDLPIDTMYVTKDGTIYWKCFKKLPNMPELSVARREPSKQYGIGDFVTLDQFPNYMFKCVDLVKESGGTAPNTSNSEVGDFIVDGGIVWVVKERINEAPTWNSLTQYQLGDTVNSTGSYSLECVSYTGRTGTDENLEFERSSYTITEQDSENNTFTVEGNEENYFLSNDIISAYYNNEQAVTTFVVVSSVYNSESNTTLITVKRYQDGTEAAIDPSHVYTTLVAPQRGTIDGGIKWDLLSSSELEHIQYAWNSYTAFDYEINILE